MRRAVHVHPATLATEVARIEDRDLQEGRKIFTPLDPAFELLHRDEIFKSKVPAELQEQP